MSARPDVPRLAEEDLDLLLSRSLDGDLSQEEEQQLERLVALDPAAARRKAELAALVADVKALPELAAPFALATRVNANIAERAGRPGSLGSRVGFFPAPGFAKTALVILVIVGAAIAILRPAPKHVEEGPVDVLLLSPPQPAGPAPRTLVAEAKPAARLGAKARQQDTDEILERAPAGERPARKGEIAEKKGTEKPEVVRQDAPTSNAVAETVPRQEAIREKGVVAGGAISLDAPSRLAAVAPAAPPAAAGLAKAVAAPSGWTVSIRGEAARRWALRRAPDVYPAPASSRPAVYRVVLDASGRVASARPVGGGAAQPGLDAFVRGMTFEPLSQLAGSLRDDKDASAPAPEATEIVIEIELTPR